MTLLIIVNVSWNLWLPKIVPVSKSYSDEPRYRVIFTSKN